jgi:hypothetical protein
MAKFTRHDPRNKKRNKHKNMSKYGVNRNRGEDDFDTKRERKYGKSDFSVYNYE